MLHNTYIPSASRIVSLTAQFDLFQSVVPEFTSISPKSLFSTTMAAPGVNTQTSSIPVGPLLGGIAAACVVCVLLILLFVYLYAVKYRNSKRQDIEYGNEMFMGTIRNPIQVQNIPLSPGAKNPIQVRHIPLSPGARNPLQGRV